MSNEVPGQSGPQIKKERSLFFELQGEQRYAYAFLAGVFEQFKDVPLEAIETTTAEIQNAAQDWFARFGKNNCSNVLVRLASRGETLSPRENELLKLVVQGIERLPEELFLSSEQYQPLRERWGSKK